VLILLAFFLCSGSAPAATIPAKLILSEGSSPTGCSPLEVTEIHPPFTNGFGEVGFVGSCATEDGESLEHFIWIDDAIVWTSSEFSLLVSEDAETTMGLSNDGGFVYNPTIDNIDPEEPAYEAIVSHHGILMMEGDTNPPGFDPGSEVIGVSEPTMTDDGTTYWLADVQERGSDGKALYKSINARPEFVQNIFRFGDLIGSFPIQEDAGGIGPDYQLTDNDHHIQQLKIDTSFFFDSIVYVNGEIVAQEGFPNIDGDLWDRFDLVSINQMGDYVFSGEITEGEMIAYNSRVVVQEGDTVDGILIEGGPRASGLSLNEFNHSAFQWTYDDPQGKRVKTLFFGCDAGDLEDGATAVATEGDQLDLSGDGLPDALLVSLNAVEADNRGLSLSERDAIHAEVTVDMGRGSVEAVVEFPLPSCSDSLTIDFGGSCPGPVSFTLSNAVPAAQIALLLGSGPGSAAIPSGNCDGIETALTDLALLTSFTADSNGTVNVTRDLTGADCGVSIQAVELSTCRLSNSTITPTLAP